MKTGKQRNLDAELQKQICQEKLILDVTEAVFEQLERRVKPKPTSQAA